MHDHEKSGLLLLLIFIPAVGAILGVIMLLYPGNDYENLYGPDPRELPISDLVEV
jgi:uncharacterized membrane protein YhaH (DUF805 family)